LHGGADELNGGASNDLLDSSIILAGCGHAEDFSAFNLI
jgi:hypothetical protein